MRAALPENTNVPVARSGEFAPLRMGSLTAWPPIVLAPMAGVTNYPFRAICRGFGAGVYVSEMINARGFLEGNARTLLLASGRADESPRSVQIYGHEPAEVGAMARVLADEGVAHIDMNFGCPVPKVTRHGGGSAIPVKPKLLARIVRAAVEGARAGSGDDQGRKGIDDSSSPSLDAGRVAESEGAAAIGLHARPRRSSTRGRGLGRRRRSRTRSASGPRERRRVGMLDALRMMRQTGCDSGVIVGRGCLRRPWLFRELAQVFDGREPDPQPDLGTIIALMHRHAALLVEFFGEHNGT
jgi:tRNA-dihydrouridine synthase